MLKQSKTKILLTISYNLEVQKKITNAELQKAAFHPVTKNMKNYNLSLLYEFFLPEQKKKNIST